MGDPRYSIREIERRWLVKVDRLPAVDGMPCWIITDKYIDGTRLRLRKMVDCGGSRGPIYKFCKKYGKVSDIEEPITNIYLAEQEFNLLNQLAGRVLVRRRFTIMAMGKRFSFNEVINGDGPAIIEAEFESVEEALNCQLPDFIGKEVSGNEAMQAVHFGTRLM